MHRKTKLTEYALKHSKNIVIDYSASKNSSLFEQNNPLLQFL